tara:strand:- start:112 stop:471 length:360 start_codon:yes stop_codon:yes gene_type:complete
VDQLNIKTNKLKSWEKLLIEQYIITVEFQLHSKEMMNDFLQHINKNAADSLRLESGCLRFDVLIPQDSSKTIFLYEIYENKKAFQLHINAKHFKIFDSNVKNLVAFKTVRQFFANNELT